MKRNEKNSNVAKGTHSNVEIKRVFGFADVFSVPGFVQLQLRSGTGRYSRFGVLVTVGIHRDSRFSRQRRNLYTDLKSAGRSWPPWRVLPSGCFKLVNWKRSVIPSCRFGKRPVSQCKSDPRMNNGSRQCDVRINVGFSSAKHRNGAPIKGRGLESWRTCERRRNSNQTGLLTYFQF